MTRPADISPVMAGDGISAAAPGQSVKRPFFKAPRTDWKEALIFLLSMSAMGLSFYPALLILVILMVRSFRRDRYHFMLQVLLFCGHFALAPVDLFPVKRADLLIVAGIAGLFLVRRRDPIVRRSFIAFLLYTLCLLWFAMQSIEEMTIQIRQMRENLSFVAYTVPLLFFAGSRFEARRFFQLAAVYSLVICVFYIIDGVFLKGWILIPASQSIYSQSTFYSPVFNPVDLTYFPRKYPQGLTLLALIVWPLQRVYRFSRKQWALVAVSFLTMRTITVLGGFVVQFLCFIGRGRKMVYAGLATGVLFIGLYFVDLAAGGFMRISSTVEQFAMLKVAEDREDLAEFGTTRMAQIIPKMELLYEQNREWTGFGFIHPELSKNNSLQIFNDLYSNVEKANENPAFVEETHITTVLQIGYIGLIVQTLFYIYLYFLVRRCRLSGYYLSVLIFVSVAGFGGFAGLNHWQGLFLLSWAYAVVLLDHLGNPQKEESGEDDGRNGTVDQGCEASPVKPGSGIAYVGPLGSKCGSS